MNEMLNVLGKTVPSSFVVSDKLEWHHQGYDIVSVDAICAAAAGFVQSYPTSCISSLRAGPVGCVSYNT